MSKPTTRAEFKEYCLRALGKPIVEINVTDMQVEDRIDYALKTFMDYHFDGSEKIYYKYQLTANNRPDRVMNLFCSEGGTGYSNGESIAIISDSGTGAAGHITTYANGTIKTAVLDFVGSGYLTIPTAEINSANGSGGNITVELGGYVPMPENVMGVVNIFEPGGTWGNLSSVFSMRYQMIANELYTLSSSSLIPYYMAMTHINLMEQMLVGQSPIRYNRYQNRLYLDTDWESINENSFLIAEAYQVVDPNQFPKVWQDRWLSEYAIELIKKQWGTNMKKFGPIPMLGGVTFSGQQIYDEAVVAIKELEYEMVHSYSIPAIDMIG